MSAPVDVLAVMDALADKADNHSLYYVYDEGDGYIAEGMELDVVGLFKKLREARAAVAELIAAAEGIDSFAWSATKADCEESCEEANKRIARVRAALARVTGGVS